MMSTRTMILALTTMTLLLAGPAGAADLGTPQAKSAGTALVITGVAVQLGGLGMATASLFDEDVSASTPRIIYHLATIPFSVLTVVGFEHMMSDGNERSRHRALALGFFQGMAYAGMVSLLAGLEMIAGPGRDPGSEAVDVGSILSLGFLLAHLPVALAFMAPAIGHSARSREGETTARRNPVLITPFSQGDAKGLAIVGRF